MLTIIARVLFLGSFKGNPALPETPVETVAASEPEGVFLVTRHPMMWGFALWALVIALWLVATWAHVWLAGIPAGAGRPCGVLLLPD